MLEIQKKYQIGVRKFGLVNWIGFRTLYTKEVSRFLVGRAQTLLSPLVSSLLFLSVLSLALGNERGEVLGFSFISFLAPGLIAMSIIQQSFSHSVSSLMIAKIQGNIIDILLPPLSNLELTIAIALGGVARGMIVGLASVLVFSFIVDMKIVNIFNVLFFAFSGSLTLSLLGIIGGIWSEKFDHLAGLTNFLITPLTFLSGSFYSIEKLP